MRIIVIMVPVKPVIRTLNVGKVKEGVTTPLRCHSDGVPEPKAEWQVAQYELPDDRERYDWSSKMNCFCFTHTNRIYNTPLQLYYYIA